MESQMFGLCEEFHKVKNQEKTLKLEIKVNLQEMLAEND